VIDGLEGDIEDIEEGMVDAAADLFVDLVERLCTSENGDILLSHLTTHQPSIVFILFESHNLKQKSPITLSPLVE